VVVTTQGEIRYIHGRTGRFLEPAQGEANLNIHDMVRPSLDLKLPIALRRAAQEKGAVVFSGIRVRSNGQDAVVDLTVKPLGEPHTEGLFMVLIREVQDEKRRASEDEQDDKQRNELLEELRRTKEDLQHAMEEAQTRNEELRSANEEYQSTNEELQSANEELNSSKEELQSLNEELETVNAELQDKVKQVETAYDEMSKMLNSLDIPTIFLDPNLCIRRFSSDAKEIVEMIETDVGRPLKHLSSKVRQVDLPEEAREVLQSMRPSEKEIKTKDDRWHLMRILPYPPDVDEDCSGVVLTFVDITQLKDVSERLEIAEEAWQFTQGIVETVREPLVVLDKDLKVISANESFYKMFHVSEDEVEDRSVFDLGDGHWEIPELRELLQEVLPKRQSFEGFEVEHDFPKLGRKKMKLNARRIYERGVAKEKILLAIEDVTGK
jgi:two-component system CheB/CheR fusion protein